LNKILDPFGNPIFNIGDVKIINDNKKMILNIFKDLEINITNINIEETTQIMGPVIVTLCKKNLYDEEY
jgi:hypothetical protein